VCVRTANLDDVPAIMHLQQQTPDATRWFPQQYADLFRIRTDRSRHYAWVVEGDSEAQSRNITGNAPGIPAFLVAAFLVAHRVDSEWELENIVVAEGARRGGIGARLLGELVAHARSERGSRIYLEVRESNRAARSLYRKLGFEETGLRKSYYSDPSEDAILCRLRL
jgi:[ribosomal protein S18]-alanine N-acetyltransferase